MRDAYYDIYSSWHSTKANTEVVRSGYGLCGIYPYDPEQPLDLNRRESDTEHAAGVADLVFNVITRPNICPIMVSPDMYWALPMVGLMHDRPERICGGDIPDDGTRNDVDKDKAEMDAMEKHILPAYAPNVREQLRQYYTEFVKKDTPAGQLLYCADKIEAVLQGFYYEMRGKVGDVRKKPRPSSDDLRRAEIIGTHELTDIFFAHFLERTAGFPEIRQPFIEVAKVACAAAHASRSERAEWVPWFDKFVNSM